MATARRIKHFPPYTVEVYVGKWENGGYAPLPQFWQNVPDALLHAVRVLAGKRWRLLGNGKVLLEANV